eukprot:606457-Prorocentrum_minimum.AAC.6
MAGASWNRPAPEYPLAKSPPSGVLFGGTDLRVSGLTLAGAVRGDADLQLSRANRHRDLHAFRLVPRAGLQPVRVQRGVHGAQPVACCFLSGPVAFGQDVCAPCSCALRSALLCSGCSPSFRHGTVRWQRRFREAGSPEEPQDRGHCITRRARTRLSLRQRRLSASVCGPRRRSLRHVRAFRVTRCPRSWGSSGDPTSRKRRCHRTVPCVAKAWGRRRDTRDRTPGVLAYGSVLRRPRAVSRAVLWAVSWAWAVSRAVSWARAVSRAVSWAVSRAVSWAVSRAVSRGAFSRARPTSLARDRCGPLRADREPVRRRRRWPVSRGGVPRGHHLLGADRGVGGVHLDEPHPQRQPAGAGRPTVGGDGGDARRVW